ncbi:MAG: iron(III) transport system permease protein [Gaiellaceae bacterium]|nr:iron(III) transport system permease protein [Gaiellaceae bacterium]
MVAVTEPSLRPRGAPFRRLLSARNVLVVVVAAVIAYLALVPLGFLMWQTFVKDGHLSFAAFRSAYSTVGLGTMVLNSFAFAIGSTVLAIVIGTVLAHLIVRSDVPGKSLMYAASVVPLIIPGILHTIAWTFLLDPRNGIVNLYVIEKLSLPAFNIYSIPGMIFVEGLHLSPLVFLLMVASFRSMDPSLEESAIMSGAPLRKVFLRVTLPLARPALYAAVLIMVVRGLESFEVPAVIGLRNHVWVFTSRIYDALHALNADYAGAGALAMSLLVICALGIWWHSRLAKRARAFQTVTGKGFRPRAMPLGSWKWPATGLIFLYFVVAVILPLLTLGYASTQAFYSPPTHETLAHMTGANYPVVFHDPLVRHAVKNSLILGFGTATAVMLMAAVAAWVVVRTRLPGRSLIDNLAFMPLVIPGLVLGVALLTVYLRIKFFPIYGTLWILFIAYLTRYMPYGMRYASTSMFQIGRELEESAQMSGAGWLQSFRRIVLPLLVPGFIAGWIYIFVVSFRELGSSVLLYSPGHEVLSIAIWQQWQDGLLPELSALGVMLVGFLVLLVAVAYKLGARIGVREGS